MIRQCGGCFYGKAIPFTHYLAEVICVDTSSSHAPKRRRASWFACSSYEPKYALTRRPVI